ncbi:type I 3-dehydroquinate dehydratase [Staphylococcus edaphicus]|uniref:3-dehydroquinate dehydratase n=1 Tax=Staphylococcus edaphicus TaxID=1955013 RepID=A0A2C6WLZ7_9STAP|nr:type I 3-dehydroquinate dehydratase [Staphylococcus edaphicus]PHK48814.1 type I 3-dehydroquinate dehydratase [Staphylococcus edaphicus]UQW80909.1 type I 3-dehydroquinate dehydratase [Staphylococcus edaphicus]
MTEVKVAVTIAPEQGLSQSIVNDLIQYQNAIDIIELRVDQWADFNESHFADIAKDISELEFNKKLLVTYRTAHQGGEGQLTDEAYIQVLEKIVNMQYVDMLDVEFEQSGSLKPLQDIIDLAHKNQIQVVLSHHNFKETPKLEAIKHLYYKMQQLESDYIKVAVMPHSKQDVLNLLSAMSETADHVSQHVVGIAMSKIGLISRTAQGVFGGSISYGCLDTPKAPGQIHVLSLKDQLKMYE